MNYFDNGMESAQHSLAYFRDNRHLLGDIVAAEVSFTGLPDHYPYCLHIRDDRGNRMFLSGVAAGYPGGAPRAAMEVLIEAGFPVTDAHPVFHDRQVVLRQPVWPPEPLPPVLPPAADRLRATDRSWAR